MKFEELKNEKFACIYMLTFLDGMRYIGKTKDIGGRIRLYKKNMNKKGLISKHIDRYGTQCVDISILNRVSLTNADDLDVVLSILEIKHIKENGTLSPNGLNLSIGGEMLGIDVSQMNLYDMNNKPVAVYDENGVLINEYSSISRAAYDLGCKEDSLRDSINKRRALFMGKYIVRLIEYGEAPKNVTPLSRKTIDKKRVNYIDVFKERTVTPSYFIPVCKYDISGMFVSEYKHKSLAAQSIGKRTIDLGVFYGDFVFLSKELCNSCSQVDISMYLPSRYKKQIVMFNSDGEKVMEFKDLNDAKSYIGMSYVRIGIYHKGFLFLKKVDVGDSCNIDAKSYKSVMGSHSSVKKGNNKKRLDGNGKWGKLINDFKIAQFDKRGTLVSEFNSIRDASEITGFRYSSIYACVKGVSKTSNGYVWKKIE